MSMRQSLSIFLTLFTMIMGIKDLYAEDSTVTPPNDTVKPQNTTPILQIKIDFDSSKGAINSSHVSTDGNTIALTGEHRILLYKLDSKSGAKIINTENINKDLMKDDAFIPTYYCDSMTACRLFELSANGKVFGFIKSKSELHENQLYLYVINKNNSISPIKIPDHDFDKVTSVSKLSISNDGQIVLAQANKEMRLYRIDMKKKVAKPISYPGNVSFDATLFSISPNGKYLILAWFKYDQSRKDNMGHVSIAKINGQKSSVKNFGAGGNIEKMKSPLSGLAIANNGSTGLVNDLGATDENGTVLDLPGVHEVLACCKTVGSKKSPTIFTLPETDNIKDSVTKAELSDDGTFVYSNKNGLFKIQGIESTVVPPPAEDLVFYKFSKNHKTFVFHHESELGNLAKNYIVYNLNPDVTFTQFSDTEIQDDTGHPSLSGDGNTFVTLKGPTSNIKQAIIYKIK